MFSPTNASQFDEDSVQLESQAKNRRKEEEGLTIYEPGRNISGVFDMSQIASFPVRKIVVKLVGISESTATWSMTGSRSAWVDHFAHPKLLTFWAVKLIMRDEEIETIRRATSSLAIPFSFTLPETLPPSCSLGHGNFIRYFLKGRIWGRQSQFLSIKKPFIVRRERVPDLEEQLLTFEATFWLLRIPRYPKMKKSNDKRKSKVNENTNQDVDRDDSEATIRVKTNRASFYPAEIINLGLLIKNNGTRQTPFSKYKLYLYQCTNILSDIEQVKKEKAMKKVEGKLRELNNQSSTNSCNNEETEYQISMTLPQELQPSSTTPQLSLTYSLQLTLKKQHNLFSSSSNTHLPISIL